MTKPVTSCWSSGLALALALMACSPAHGQTDLFVSSNATGNILRYNSSGSLLNGTYISGLNSPRGVLVDSMDNLYVAATTGGQVLEYTPGGTLIHTITAGLTHPVAMALDSAGNLWVSNQGSSGTNGTVNEYTSDGFLLNSVTGMTTPTGIAVGPDGNIYVAENPGIGLVAQISPFGFVLNPIYINGLSSPRGLAFNSSGLLFVAESTTNDVKVYNSGTQTDTITNGVNAPAGLTFSLNGDLYVANGNGNISQYDASDNLLNSSFISGIDTPTYLAFVPEPTTAGLLAFGAIGIAFCRRR